MVWRPDPIEFLHYRDHDEFEVDVVLEFGGAAVAGIEGVVLYDGTASVSFGDRLFAVPIRRVWESQ